MTITIDLDVVGIVCEFLLAGIGLCGLFLAPTRQAKCLWGATALLWTGYGVVSLVAT